MAAMRRQRLSLIARLLAASRWPAAARRRLRRELRPARPTYKNDIAPLMEAHCIRCHGAGGTLNADPDIPKIACAEPSDAERLMRAKTTGNFTT